MVFVVKHQSEDTPSKIILTVLTSMNFIAHTLSKSITVWHSNSLLVRLNILFLDILFYHDSPEALLHADSTQILYFTYADSPEAL